MWLTGDVAAPKSNDCLMGLNHFKQNDNQKNYYAANGGAIYSEQKCVILTNVFKLHYKNKMPLIGEANILQTPATAQI